MKRIFTLTALLLLVFGAANATVTAKWDWQNGVPNTISSVNIETFVGNVVSNVDGVTMFVDATSGKLKSNGDNAQFNTGAKLRIPVVSTADIVTVKGHSYNWNNIKIGGTTYTDQTKEYTAAVADVTQGYVEIEAVSDIYLYSIQVELAYMPPTPVTATWDFVGDCANLSSTGSSTNSLTPIVSDNPNISLDVVYNGQSIRDNGDSYQLGNGVVLHIPVVSTDDQLTFVYHSETYGKFTYGSGDTESTGNDDTYSPTAADVAQGFVAIAATTEGNSYLKSITVTQKSFVSVTIGTTEWVTFSYTAPVDFTNLSGVVSAYTVTGHSGSAITTDDVTTAAANTGLLLNAEAGTYAIPLAATGTDLSTTNLLKPGTGAAVSAVDGKTRYVLAADGSTAVFKKINAIAATVPVGKAYLEFDGDVPAPSLSFDFGETTGINAVNGEGFMVNGEYYNLAGQRVAQPTKGLYIVNGKKVVIK